MADRGKPNYALIAGVAAATVVAGAAVYFLTRPAAEPEPAEDEPTKPSGSRGAAGGGGKASGGSSSSGSGSATNVDVAKLIAKETAVAASGGQRSSGLAGRTLSREQYIRMVDEMIDRLNKLKDDMEARQELYLRLYGEERAVEKYQEEVTREVSGIESELHAKYGVDEMQVLALQQQYKDDDDVKTRLAALKRIILGDAPDPDSVVVPEGMTPEKFWDMFQEHLRVSEASFDRLVAEAKAEAPGNDPQEVFGYFQMLLMRRGEGIREEANQAVGMTDDDFQACLIKFGNSDPRIMDAVVAMQSRQQQRMMELLGGAST